MKDLVVLYDKEDVLEFNKYSKEFKNVFLFSPGIESYLKKNQNINIIKPKISSDSFLQKEIINKSKKIYKKFEQNLHSLNGIDKGIIENIHNIFFVSVFSFMYLIENLKEYQNFKLIYKNKYYEFDNFKSFIPLFLEKIFLKRNQDFFFYLRSTQLSKYKKMMIIINNFICTFVKSVNSKLISGSLLTKKIEKENKNNEMIIFQLKPYQDFKIYHMLLNFLSTVNIFKKKKILYLFPTYSKCLFNDNLRKNLEIFFNDIKDENLDYFKNFFVKYLIQYCNNQQRFYESVFELVNLINPNYVLVDQLRFDISTILASVCLSKKKDVILVPHGSISIPEDEFSKFVLPICARGLIFSKIATISIAQSKISYEAIKYYDQNIKILKSKPILFGKEFINKSSNRKNNFRFLHASTPKSLSKWPWIYENYNEYIDNINGLINSLKHYDNVELLIRFREGPECDIETFKKLIDIDKNTFVQISKSNDFFDDLDSSDCLISFSSTSIEEALFANKKILIYSDSRNYKHINYKFEKDNDIIYANKNNINRELKNILNGIKTKKYNILWNEQISDNEKFNQFYL